MNWLIKLLTRLATNKKIYPNHGLSPRERQVLALMAQGDSNKLIAYKLDMSEQTVKNHCTHIYLKMGVTSRVQAVVRAIQ